MPIATALRALFGLKQCPDTTGLVIGREHPEHWWQKPAPIVLTPQSLRSHLLVTGTAGSGAYSLVTSLLAQQTQAGLGWVILDPYGDPEVRDALYSKACAEGRGDQFYCLDFAGGSSHAYDWLVHGDIPARVRKLLLWQPAVPPEVGSRLEAILTAILTAYGATNTRPIRATELVALLNDPVALQCLQDRLPGDSSVALELRRMLASHYGADAQAWVGVVADLKSLVLELSEMLATPVASAINGTGAVVSFADILRKDQMCYVAFSGLGHSVVTKRIAQCIAEDLFAAIEQHTSKSQFIVAIREPLLLTPQLYGKYASIARGSRVTLLSQLQDAGMLELVEGSEFVSANAATRIVFRHPGRAGAEASSHLLGLAAEKSVSPDEICALAPTDFLVQTSDGLLTRGAAWLEPSLAIEQGRHYKREEAA